MRRGLEPQPAAPVHRTHLMCSPRSSGVRCLRVASLAIILLNPASFLLSSSFLVQHVHAFMIMPHSQCGKFFTLGNICIKNTFSYEEIRILYLIDQGFVWVFLEIII